MKALLAAHGTPYPYTHKLDVLEDLLAALNERMPATPFLVINLTAFAVKQRYDLGPPLSESERNAIRDTVAIVREHILTRILALEAATQPPPAATP
jgi:hypothetical protein